jgi:8-oxo-dGTP diphosphatase
MALLGLKKRGFGEGKFGGFGGKIEPGESPALAAARELYEESGVQVAAADLVYAAHLTFEFPARQAWDIIVHAFVARRWRGEAAESEEMRPAWFPVESIPYHRMWDDARFWLPPVLSGERLRGHFVFNGDNETVARCRIEKLDSPPAG